MSSYVQGDPTRDPRTDHRACGPGGAALGQGADHSGDLSESELSFVARCASESNHSFDELSSAYHSMREKAREYLRATAL